MGEISFQSFMRDGTHDYMYTIPKQCRNNQN